MKHRRKTKRIATTLLSLALCCAMALEGPVFSARAQEPALPTPGIAS